MPPMKKITHTPPRVRIKVESNISRSAPVAMDKHMPRMKSTTWYEKHYENDSTSKKLFRTDDLDEMFETRNRKIVTPKKQRASMPRALTMMEKKELNRGLCHHLHCHVYWLRLNVTSQNGSADKHGWNANSLRAIATIIETQAEETLMICKDGDYSFIPNVGKAFSKIIHAYFLAAHEEES